MKSLHIIGVLILIASILGCATFGLTEEDKEDITQEINDYFAEKNSNMTNSTEITEGSTFYEYTTFLTPEDLEIISSNPNEATIRVNVTKNLNECINIEFTETENLTEYKEEFKVIDSNVERWEFKLRKENGPSYLQLVYPHSISD
ncbi:hypothetical protein [Methanothermobacter tenebrarum]|uniref:Lipoprotein n=1 Tax=Methanothermobacter tenebrarum TaxID=680118 RepID=A0A328PG94_9EURY|nr:hypothetical protein [Methanothermobacter tenebrarum]MBC7100353.1 hypothetical protein [Methanobacteriales archaeon]MBC7118796.1 hypothetical protein [Methanobacteriaceae archaeon]NPV64388.1 hypothetical protein [Methanobacteriaceae archaeon]RAO78835.1 hypothetical protein DPC56_06145 [Methanothermobacter tenebrarum]